MSDTSLQDLYSDRILTLAANIPNMAPLDHVDGHGQRRSNTCGSTVGVDIAVTDGRITGFAQTVRACALGQASAAIFGAVVSGCTREQVERLCEQLQAMLSGGPVPDAPFDEYRVLQAARDYPARHASIMLAPQATLAAFDAV